jgi:rhamnogalacturonan hydrolase
MNIRIAPEFHVVIQGGSNGEVYNLAIRGANIGGSDGVDISGLRKFFTH